MHQSRDIFRFNESLKEIQKLAAARDAKKRWEDVEFPEKDKDLLEKYFASEIKKEDLTLEARMYCSLQTIQDQRKDPFFYSELPGLLELETWKPEVALLILAGIEPIAPIFEWSYENFMGAEVHEPKIRHANCFSDVGDLYDWPVVEDFEFDSTTLKRMIKEAEKNGSSQQERDKFQSDLDEIERWSQNETSQYVSQTLALRATMLGVLKTRWDSGDHDPAQKQSPVYFVRWAEKRGFNIEWAEWARKNQFLPEGESAETPPYFDADGEDYPELLHIAVRAWDHARNGDVGTPKQRIQDFIKQRYPHIKEGTRDAIALVANWQKSGGRPKTGG